MGQGVLGYVAESGTPIWNEIGHSLKSSLPPYAWPDESAVLAVPLTVGRRLVGAIEILKTAPKRGFRASDLNLLDMFAQQAAIAIENAQLFASAKRLAQTDSLTGLYNRRHFFELAQREFQRARRYDRPLSALMLDIDHFKRVNDNFGHAIGDQVLIEVAEICNRELRQIDLIGRFGGEEFAILLIETNLQAAQRVAERLRETIEKAIRPSNENLSILITTSVGVAYLNEDCPNLDTLLDQADKALYVAKQSGRNKVALMV
jgi:diguanylate cyclase (GGDEF)-like protein